MLAYRLTPQGFEPLSLPPGSLEEHTLTLGGLYTTFRTWEQGSRFLGLSQHLRRLYRGGGQPGLSLEEMERALRQLITSLAPSGELRVRMVSAFAPAAGCFALLEPFTPPETNLYRHGVRVISLYLPRPHPLLKTTAFLARAAAARASLPPDIYEAIRLSRSGKALEGLSSNFYLVRSGEIVTARQGILLGVTRRLTLRQARRLRLPITYAAPDLRSPFEEAFLTSSSRGLMPIVEIDGQPVGEGLPGPITRHLMDALGIYPKISP